MKGVPLSNKIPRLEPEMQDVQQLVKRRVLEERPWNVVRMDSDCIECLR